jgi:hypothetical protein
MRRPHCAEFSPARRLTGSPLFQAAQPVIYLDSENISMRAIGRGIWIGLCGAFGFTLLPQLSQTSPPQNSIFSMLFMVSKPRTSPDKGQNPCQTPAIPGVAKSVTAFAETNCASWFCCCFARVALPRCGENH